MTSGVMLPLTTADLLAMTIVGSVLENMDMERLIAGERATIPVPASTETRITRDRNGGRSADQGEGSIDGKCRTGSPVSPRDCTATQTDIV